MLTARDELPDKIAGFRAGADDYLTKPFALPELEVRIEALLARARGRSRSRVLEVEDLRLDLSTLEASRGGQLLHLYPACRKLLETLMQASPAAVPRERLEHALWGDDPPDGDMLRSHVYELRRSVDGPFAVKLIHTLPRVGYRLAVLEGRTTMRDVTMRKTRPAPHPLLAGAYMLLLSAVVIAAGASIHEHVEHLAWKSLLHSELDHYLPARADRSGLSLERHRTLRCSARAARRRCPPALAGCKPGLHDDVLIDGSERVVLVRDRRWQAGGAGAGHDRIRGGDEQSPEPALG